VVEREGGGVCGGRWNLNGAALPREWDGGGAACFNGALLRHGELGLGVFFGVGLVTCDLGFGGLEERDVGFDF
jgi:hypothetical protein